MIFLATLGVYFGLVLIGGATPQVYAQAATTRTFELKDEVEVKDDLDKTPIPNVEDLTGAIETYFKDLEEFVQNLQKLHSIEKFDTDSETFSVERVSFLPCPHTRFIDSTEKDSYIDRWLWPAIIEVKFASENQAGLGDCLSRSALANVPIASSAGIKLIYDKSELKHELFVDFSSLKRTNLVFDNLSKAFNLYKLTDEVDRNLNKVLLRHTSISKADNQVFIITRLPRAGLDSLLAKDAK